MAFDNDEFVKRFNEAVGEDSQEIIARKLHMTQGNVSKIITGKQLPKLDTIYLIAEEYGVSADWLMGLSDEKKIRVPVADLTYTDAVEAIMSLAWHGAEIQADKWDEVVVTVKDPLFKALVAKSKALRAADKELYESWKRNKLSLFADKPFLWKSSWNDRDLNYYAAEATKEEHWVKVYEAVKEQEDAWADAMADNPGPFDD